MRKNWVRLNLFYLGQSNKKHQIFRVKQWNINLERILKQPVFNEKYERVCYIKDIFGPIKLPFISIKVLPNQDQSINPNDIYFTKIG